MGFGNEWHQQGQERVFLAQPTRVLKGLSPEAIEDEIEDLWQDFCRVREDVDRVVIYLDMPGTPELLDRLRTAGFASRDLIFILCDCRYLETVDMLHARGFAHSVKHRSLCGVTLLDEMFQSQLYKGQLKMAS